MSVSKNFVGRAGWLYCNCSSVFSVNDPTHVSAHVSDEIARSGWLGVPYG